MKRDMAFRLFWFIVGVLLTNMLEVFVWGL